MARAGWRNVVSSAAIVLPRSAGVSWLCCGLDVALTCTGQVMVDASGCHFSA